MHADGADPDTTLLTGHFAADCNRPKKEERYRRDEKEDRIRRDEKSDDRSKDDKKTAERHKERSKDRRMRARADKKPSRKYDRKVLVAEESTKSWADTDSESSSSSSSSSDSEQEEVHCLMADQTSDDEVSMDIVSVAQDVVPIQIVEPTPAAAVVQSPAPKRRYQKRKLILSTGSDDENLDEQEPIKDTTVKHTDEVEVIIGQVLEETSMLATDETEPGDQRINETEIGDDFEKWLDESFKDFASRDDEPAIKSTSGMDRGTGTEERVAYEQSLEMVDETGTTVEADGSEQEVAAMNTEKFVCSKHSNEEQISLDDLLMQISKDMMLPSVTAAEVTKIRLAESIVINEVQERDWYYANLPRISTHDKGKDPLEEDEPIKGNPTRETVELICGDVDFLVQLRDQVMKDVVEFFHSFSLNKLSDLDALRDLKEKEKLMLDWEETDSLETAVRRKMYILAKYREMLLRKFLDSHRRYFAPGQPWTAMASKIIDLLSVAHSISLEDLLAQQKEHGIITDRPSSSQLFKDLADNSGTVLAQFYSMAKSTCWVWPMILIDGIWTPIQGTDYWKSSCRLSLFVNRKQVPESVVDTTFVPHGLFIKPVQYWGDAPSLIKTWGWARVCTEIVRYSLFGCLRLVSENFCRDIVVFSSAVDILEKLPTSFRSIFQQGVYTDSFVDYFSSSDVQNIAEVDLVSSDGSAIYRSPSRVCTEIVRYSLFGCLRLVSENFCRDIVVFSSAVDILEKLPTSFRSIFQQGVYTDSFVDYFSSSDVQNIAEVDLVSSDGSAIYRSPSPQHDSFTEAESTQPSIHVASSSMPSFSVSDLLLRGLRDTLRQQDEYFRHLVQSARQDGKNHSDLHLLHLNEFKKSVLAHNVTVIADFMDVKKVVRELNAKVDAVSTRLDDVRQDIEATKEAISHQLLDFQAQAQANHNILTGQLSELVNYINRSSNDKKGEGSIRGPQPPPDDQNRGSGNIGGGGDTDRSFVERLITADRQRQRERSRGHSSGSYKRRRY
ncbi:cell division control protein 2C [Dorcoceras hygrometricum]|uniref:Cell division control protein 2C n=1 Tax=Dorcoceras hygrometricum TaxID=472368 RepID=A0A2Z7CX74_9LAMI|nr:cell division control protein 2C [Dorcoceras hygrometricum]